jgi:hypothetical protein
MNPEAEQEPFEGTADLVERSVAELSHVARRLRLIGQLVLLATVANIGVLLWEVGRSTSHGRKESLAILSIAMAVATLAGLGVFEALRKRGDAIFQELSDELQWHVGRRSVTAVPWERPLLHARIALRTFSAVAELPLLPGRYGGAIYAGLNLSVALASALFLRF